MIDYHPGVKGKCPHCGVVVQFIDAKTYREAIGSLRGEDNIWVLGERCSKAQVYSSACPNCHLPIIAMNIEWLENYGTSKVKPVLRQYLVFPRSITRFIPKEVPDDIRATYSEAAEVMQYSEMSSAALSRRCLQMVLRERGIKGNDLNDEIDKAMPNLPSHIADNLHAIRQIGNFAAHPSKYKTTGLIVEVEPEEAEFLLDVLDLLFDFYYVMPERSKEKRESLNKKLIGMGKKPLNK